MILRLFCICTFGALLAHVICRKALQRPDSTNITLRVYHYKVPCVGENVQLCFKVEKQIGTAEYFYDAIEGFRYEWGYDYTIIVERKSLKTGVADASTFTYTLKQVVKKEKVSPEETFELPLRIDDRPLIETSNGSCRYFGNIPIQTGTYSCSELVKASFGVFRHSVDNAGLLLVKLK
jgi:hypothetical protein